MHANLQICDAVIKVFGKYLQKVSHPTIQWSQFTTFQSANTGENYLLKLIQVPSSYHISEQIYLKKLQKLGNYVHKVKFYFVERQFQSSYYLVQAEQNFTSVKSMIKLAKQSNQILQQNVIYQFLEYANLIQKSKYSQEIAFDLNQIGKSSSNKFVVANYQLFFEAQIEQTLSTNIRNTLYSMLTLSQGQQSINVDQIQTTVQKKYDDRMMKLVQKFIQTKASSSQIFVLVNAYQEARFSDNNTTLTQSYIDDGFNIDNIDNISQVLANTSCSTDNDLSLQNLQKISSFVKKRNRKKKLCLLITIFIILLLGIGAVTYEYLANKTISCGVSEYQDPQSKRCLSCASQCEQCKSGDSFECTSCKGSMYLVTNYTSQSVGCCQTSCKGTVINSKHCVLKY